MYFQLFSNENITEEFSAGSSSNSNRPGFYFCFKLYSDLRCALHLRYRIEQTGNGCIADLLVLV